MIRLPGTVTYPDGREQRIEVTQAEYAAFELWALRNGFDPTPERAPTMAMTRYLGYAAIQRAAGIHREHWPAFEDWEASDVTLDVPEDAERIAADAAVFLKARSAE